MSNSPAVQAARKDMQLARLEAKGKKNYPAFYAAQPQQKVRAKKNAEWLAARNALKAANEALEIAEITGVGLEAAIEAQAVAALVAERTKPGKSGSSASASNAGA